MNNADDPPKGIFSLGKYVFVDSSDKKSWEKEDGMSKYGTAFYYHDRKNDS